ncbi:MAG TPA: ribonuclease H-like domain-containing protein [Candidatus Limiplasma sp.]|nr:ribonuclease H-like domain-containing protein [Candidatus Limiplasma sp.]HRX09418.1 ribonuclease H-like domain-containing protein [Candidatus Limiplasma sp.]
MPSLSDKLRMISAEHMAQSDMPKKTASQDCYRVSERYPIASFPDARHMNADILKEIYGFPFPVSVKMQDLLFLDTETTGLSRGAGTVAFLVGIGYFTQDHFVVEQYLMRDYDEELFVLQEVSRLLEAFPVLVTFNGRTFDMPVLQSRFLLNRFRDKYESVHADVLYPSRRLWKLRLGSCNLQTLEESVLGVVREGDIPGAMIPQTYFKYLENRDFEPIRSIMAHNRQDITSLAQLFFFLCRLHLKPETIQAPEDLFSLARTLNKRGDALKAKKCFRLSAQGGLRPSAFHALAEQEKREGHAQRAAKLYTAMLSSSEDTADVCVALAKLYEHQLRDLSQALLYTRQALLILSEPGLEAGEAVQSRRNALQYRYARLRRKIAGGSLG